MKNLPDTAHQKLSAVKNRRTLRTKPYEGIDFLSNDYLGLSRSNILLQETQSILGKFPKQGGATGSRLISGNHELYRLLEEKAARFHDVESCLVFNSGYLANLALLSSLPQRNDVVLYDVLCHASIKDGIRLGFAKAFPFGHNDLEDLLKKIHRSQELQKQSEGVIYVVIESLYSMDGDCPNLPKAFEICERYGCFLIVDEAHATGTLGKEGKGLTYDHGLQRKVLAQIHTFGKAFGTHGAVICGSKTLTEFLINFARPLIYTTALPIETLARIYATYQFLETDLPELYGRLRQCIDHFTTEVKKRNLSSVLSQNDTAIQTLMVPGEQRCKTLEKRLATEGFDVKAILAPTVSKGFERLRICLHSFNQTDEVGRLIHIIASFL